VCFVSWCAVAKHPPLSPPYTTSCPLLQGGPKQRWPRQENGTSCVKFCVLCKVIRGWRVVAWTHASLKGPPFNWRLAGTRLDQRLLGATQLFCREPPESVVSP
jgi:hypothetical protein